MSATKYIALFVVIVFHMEIVLSVLPIHISNFTCSENDDYSSNVECSFLTLNSRMQVLNFETEFIKILKSVMIHFKLYKKQSNGELKPFKVDATENLCKFLDSNERSNILSRLMPNWKQYGSFPQHCPIKGLVYMRRYPMDLSFFPSTFPAGEFLLTTNLIEGTENISVLNTSIAFAVKY